MIKRDYFSDVNCGTIHCMKGQGKPIIEGDVTHINSQVYIYPQTYSNPNPDQKKFKNINSAEREEKLLFVKKILVHSVN